MQLQRLFALAVCALALACSREAPRPNVLLITIDTLRADHLSCYGYGRPTSPNLDRLAREGLCFTHAQSPRAKTTPAMASVFTGLYPHEHGVRDLLQPLDARTPLLAEAMQRAGYATAAIVGNFVLKREHAGLARGFDTWVESLPQRSGVPPNDAPQRTAHSLTRAARVALGLTAAPATDEGGAAFEPSQRCVSEAKPWFLWLHYMDPHGAYEPPQEHRLFQRAIPDPIPPAVDPKSRGGRMQRIADYNVPPSARMADGRIDAALVRDLYDGEIHYVDAEIGRLLDEMTTRGFLENTLVIVTADHGESLGEHDYWFEHGLYAYENTCRVPLIVRLPKSAGVAPGLRREDFALADLAPTLLEYVHAGALARSADAKGATPIPRGISRVAQFASDVPRGEPVFCEKIERAEELGTLQSKAVRAGDWKLIRRYAHAPGKSAGDKARLVLIGEELYDLARDPHETDDLAAHPPAATPLAELREELLRFVAADPSFPELGEILARRRAALEKGDAEALKALKALGY